MSLLITVEAFEEAGSREVIPFTCGHCRQPSARPKHRVQAFFKREGDIMAPMFCSRECAAARGRAPHTFACAQCGEKVIKQPSVVKRSRKRGLVNHFCSNKCAGTYTAAHKKTGTRRAKLEKWLEEQLNRIYPQLRIDFNQTSAIKAELDIYVPSLRVAFELNGVFHYEPIFGSDKLTQTQNKDRYKYHACTEAGIDLCVIDTSRQRYFKEKHCKPYLDIITKIIDERMAITTGLAPASYSS